MLQSMCRILNDMGRIIPEEMCYCHKPVNDRSELKDLDYYGGSMAFDMTKSRDGKTYMFVYKNGSWSVESILFITNKEYEENKRLENTRKLFKGKLNDR